MLQIVTPPDGPNRYGLIAPVAAAGLFTAGMAIEFGTRQLLAATHSYWLLRPVLYAALPKPGFREHPLALALEVAGVPFGLWWIWFLKAVPGQRLLAVRLGVGLIVGGAVGLFVASVVFDTSANVFVLKLGAWGYAFSPFDLPMLVGLALVLSTILTSSLDDAFGAVRWRDVLLPRSRR